MNRIDADRIDAEEQKGRAADGDNMNPCEMNPCKRVRSGLEEGAWLEFGGEAVLAMPDELRSHVSGCSSCGEALAQAVHESEQLDRFLARAVPAWRSSVPRGNLTEEVLARLARPEVNEDSPEPTTTVAQLTDIGSTGIQTAHRLTRRWRSIALLMTVAVALVVWVVRLPAPNEGPVQIATGPQGAAASPSETKPLAPPREEPLEPLRLSLLLADANVAWSDLARETSATMGDVVSLSRPTSPLPEDPATTGAAAEEGAGPLLQVPVEWIPLRKQVGGALDFLRETLRDDAEGQVET